jgi:hypothetical protein
LSHQSQSNLLLSDNESSLLAKVSGHSSSNCCKDDVNDNNNQCRNDISTTTTIETKQTNLTSKRFNHDNDNNNGNNNHLNFARVSLKTIKNKIKLNASYSLTLLQNASSISNEATKANNNENSHDTIIYNSNSIDSGSNKKILIKSKSITGCMNDDVDQLQHEEEDELPPGDCDETKKRGRSKINSISSASGENANKLTSSNGNEIKAATNDVVDAIPSSCSSTSNENNNEIVVIKNPSGEERKLLNVNLKRNTNPFLSDVCSKSGVIDEKDDTTKSKFQHFIANEIDNTQQQQQLSTSNHEENDDRVYSSGNAAKATVESSKLKNLGEKIPHGSASWREDYHDGGRILQFRSVWRTRD